MNFITHAQLAAWLDRLAGEQTLIAPLNVAGVQLYRPVKESAAIDWEYTRPLMSAKEFFLPLTERLMLVERDGGDVRLTETLPEERQVLFGVRPCDAQGLHSLDCLYLIEQPADPYYARRRENTTLVGMACQQMWSSCFCTSLGSGPDNPTGMDIMLTHADGGYIVQVLTEKGRALLDEPWQEIDSLPPGTVSKPKQDNPVYNIPLRSEWPLRFNDDFWAATGERCLSCRVCAYMCPTCRCFDIRDEMLPDGNGHNNFERIRCWDSCNGIPYRRVAGGHNPRSGKNQRLRNRFFCKFDFFPQQYGPISCTGCGRCIDACPVNVDITEVLDYVDKHARVKAGGTP